MNILELSEKINSSNEFKEIWVHHNNGQRICALINGNIGWLMYLRHERDIGFSTRNPNEKKEQDLKFILNNGQEDCYPRNWCYSVKTLEIAMIFFLKNGEKPNNVEWHDDSL